MEFKFNSFVWSLLMVMVVVSVVVNSSIIETSDYEEDTENTYFGVKVYSPSRECSMNGGLCVKKGDCASGQLTHKAGLCPNRDSEVECCYEVIPKEGPCQAFGGECMAECAQTLRQSLGNDCGDKTCCILVK